MAFPTVTATIDDLERSDGSPGGDWGATAAFNSAGLALAISDGRLIYPAAGADNGYLQTVYGPDVELQVEFNSTYLPADGDAFVAVARGSDFGSTGWDGVYVVLIGGAGGTGGNDTWEIRERVGGSPSTLVSTSSSKLRPDLGDRLGLEVVGDTVTAYKVRAGVATQITTATTTVTDAGQFAVELAPASGTFDGIEQLIGGTKVPAGNILYVAPGVAGASDSHTYEQAQSPTTPLASFDGAFNLVQNGDHVRMVDDVTDGFQFPQLEALSPVLATNVVVEGWNAVLGDSATWHVRNLHLRGVDRWTFRNLVTYGQTQGDISELDGCSNMTFENWEAQRGGANILSALGDWLWDGGSVTAPLDGPALNYLDGVGWRIFHTFEGTTGIGNVEFRDHLFFAVQGEDGCQFLGGTSNHTGVLRFTRCHWRDFTQADVPNAPHTDGVQIIGANHVIFDSPLFERVASMIITSDDYCQHLELINADFAGDGHGGYSTQFFGLFRLTARNCRWNGSGFGGLRVGYDSRLSATNPVEGAADLHLVIDVANCIIDWLGYTEGIDDPDNDQAATIIQSHNLIAVGPLGETDTRGFGEYGHTGSGEDIVLGELANTPAGTNSAAIDTGLSHADDALVPQLDRLGRPRKGAGTDLGPYESDPAVEVTVDQREIRVVSTSPIGGAIDVDRNTIFEIVLSPTPGQTIDQATVTDESFNVADAVYAERLPVASRTISEPDEDGNQALRIAVDGTLDPAVGFITTVTTDVADSEGSTLLTAKQWTAYTAGRGGPALTPDEGGEGTSDGWALGVSLT